MIEKGLGKLNKIIYNVEYIEVQYKEDDIEKNIKIGDEISFFENINNYFKDKENLGDEIIFNFHLMDPDNRNLEYVNKYQRGKE